jgi:hypothetical protein
MTWHVPNIWEGGDVFILGGGPSVTKQFNIPDEVVQAVISGASPLSAYSPYMTYLHDKHVIGINVAYLIGDWIDMVFFGDSGFFLKHQQGLAKFPGLKVSCHPTVEKADWVKHTARDRHHSRGISDNPRMASWNGNSGAAAISVAANAGAKRIILLGFDMKLNADSRQWFHGVYNKKSGVDTNKKRPKHLPFERHLRGFPEIARDAKKRGISIINLCPDSAIQEFPKYSLKEFIENEHN